MAAQLPPGESDLAALVGRLAEAAALNTTASCGTGCRGKYSVSVPFTVSKQEVGAVLVHDDDAAGTGSPPHSVQIPVTLLP